MRGKVVSTKMKDTATVVVTSTKTHPLYKKSFIRTKKYLVADELGVKMGDLVEIEKIRPISKMKHWKILKVVGRDIEEMVSNQLKEQAADIIEEVMPEKEEESVEAEVAVETEKEVEKKEEKSAKTKKASKK